MFTIGGTNSTIHKTEMATIPFYNTDNSYTVKILNIITNKNDIKMTNYPQYTTKIDSGVTLTMMPKELYSKVIENIDKYCESPNKCLGNKFNSIDGQCYRLNININSHQFIESMPIIKFIFENNVDYLWRPNDYLYKQDGNLNDRSAYCIGLLGSR
jgi:hypothetical protein